MVDSSVTRAFEVGTRSAQIQLESDGVGVAEFAGIATGALGGVGDAIDRYRGTRAHRRLHSS